MKRLLSIILVLVLGLSVVLTGCSDKKGTDGTDDSKGPKVKVGMVTDSGTIDDKSFNQGTWEGVQRYAQEKGTIAEKYLKPNGEQTSDYVTAIDNLVEADYKVIVTPGFKFIDAITEAGAKYPEVKFVLIDGAPSEARDNVVSVFFNEHEAGFLAGVAAATDSKSGKLGFVGGMEIPPVQKFGWGFKAGVKYANDNLGTKAEVVDYVYEGSFNNVAGGKSIAAGMYGKGIDVIFHAAGGVGAGVINEAKERAEKGDKVFVVGVDSDQYSDGEISDGTSVILTSAMKRVDTAAFDFIDAAVTDKFPGGETKSLSLAEAGVGLPSENPNMSDAAKKNVEAATKAISGGEVEVPATQEALDAFLK